MTPSPWQYPRTFAVAVGLAVWTVTSLMPFRDELLDRNRPRCEDLMYPINVTPAGTIQKPVPPRSESRWERAFGVQPLALLIGLVAGVYAYIAVLASRGPRQTSGETTTAPPEEAPPA